MSIPRPKNVAICSAILWRFSWQTYSRICDFARRDLKRNDLSAIAIFWDAKMGPKLASLGPSKLKFY